MKKQWKALTVIAIVLALFVVGCSSPSPTVPVPPTATPVPPSMTVAFAGGTCTYDGPKAVPAGPINVIMDVKDQDREAYALVIVTLDQGKTINDMKAWMPSTAQPSWAQIVAENEEGLPGKRNTFAAWISSDTVAKGAIFLACFSKPPEVSIGALGPIEVGN
jgi:hypothetical protein